MAMVLNTAWLLEYLDTPAGSSQESLHEAVREAWPAVGLEIEAGHKLQSELTAVRIGFVREKSPISGADGMFACRIEIVRGEMLPVVCASEHEVRVGWGVPVAPAGTTLPTGVDVKAGHYHGVDSRGMICLDG